MSGYGFGRKPARPQQKPEDDRLDLSGIVRTPLPLDPAREAAAIARGDALGFVDRGEQAAGDGQGSEPGIRRRRQSAPQASLYIKGPKDTLDWFVDFTNQRGHRSYWQTIAELRGMIEHAAEKADEKPDGAS